MQLRASSTCLSLGLSVLLFTGLSACDGQEAAGGSGSSGSGGSNTARFMFDCALTGGLNGELTLDVEAIGTTGIVFGSGPNPEITGVIGTGSVTYVTAGELRSTTLYIFTGDNQFANFTEIATSQRFLVQWVPNNQGLIMVINPFGPGPTQHTCVTTGARYL